MESSLPSLLCYSPIFLLNLTFRPSNKTGGPFKQRKCQCLSTIQAPSPSSLSAPLSSSKVKTMPPPLHSYSTQSSAEGSGLSTKKSRRAQVSEQMQRPPHCLLTHSLLLPQGICRDVRRMGLTASLANARIETYHPSLTGQTLMHALPDFHTC